MKYLLILFVGLFSLFSCKSVDYSRNENKAGWFNIAVANDVEIFTDTLSIRHEGAIAYAREKRVFVTDESRKLYVDKIRDKYLEMKKPEKADKWRDFSYCIYYNLYDCTNKRFRVLSVEDYDINGKLILRTVSPKEKIKWSNVETETVGDYTFFFVCDYNN